MPTKPHNFSPDTLMRAEEMNANFDAFISWANTHRESFSHPDNSISTDKLADSCISGDKLPTGIPLEKFRSGCFFTELPLIAPHWDTSSDVWNLNEVYLVIFPLDSSQIARIHFYYKGLVQNSSGLYDFKVRFKMSCWDPNSDSWSNFYVSSWYEFPFPANNLSELEVDFLIDIPENLPSAYCSFIAEYSYGSGNGQLVARGHNWVYATIVQPRR